MKCKECFFIIVAVLSMFLACKKDTNVTNYPAAGLYEGSYTLNNAIPQTYYYFSLVLYPDGTLVVRGKNTDGSSSYAYGTYTISGTAFSGTASTFTKSSGGIPVTQAYTGTYSNAGTLSNCTWADTINPFGVLNSGKMALLQRIN